MKIYTALTNDYIKTMKVNGNKITTSKWSFDCEMVAKVKVYERTVSYSSIKTAERIAEDKWFDTCRQAEQDGLVKLTVETF